jgi:transposase
LSASLQTAPGITSGRRQRRSWSDAEKQLLIAEALLPGASVADIARRHGVNANLLFNWRRTALAVAVPSSSDQPGPAVERAEAHQPATTMTTAADFIPIGVFTRAPDGGPGLRAAPAAPPIARSSPRIAEPRQPEMETRPGLIEIDLVCGTRLRVDAFVNEKALQRVLAALTKAGA